MPPPRRKIKRPLLLVAGVAVCAWLATWVPVRRWWGPDGSTASRPSEPSSAPHAAESGRQRADPLRIDAAKADRLFGRYPDLREDLMAWRFDSAFVRADSPELLALVEEELGRAVGVLVERVRAGRILEARRRVEEFAVATDPRVRAANVDLAGRLGVPPAAFAPGPYSRPHSSRSGPSIGTLFELAKGRLVRAWIEGEIKTGRVETVDHARDLATLRVEQANGVVFPQVEARGVEPVQPDPDHLAQRSREELDSYRHTGPALWIACAEGLGPDVKKRFESLRHTLEQDLR